MQRRSMNAALTRFLSLFGTQPKPGPIPSHKVLYGIRSRGQWSVVRGQWSDGSRQQAEGSGQQAAGSGQRAEGSEICYTVFMANQLARPPTHALIPAQIAAAGPDARRRFLEFFTANIRNRNTRAAYAQAVSRFFRWCEVRGLRELGALEPVHVAAYVENLGKTHAAPSVKQHLAAVRMLFDWLVVGQVVRSNPASVVRGPKHVVKRGRTPILSPEEARALFESFPTDSLVGLRDRALIGVLIYSFARISAALSMRVEDYFPQGKRWWLRLHEKGGKNHEMPVHHTLEEYLDALRSGGWDR